jgi:FAD/FMN-containing dehydrogenase
VPRGAGRLQHWGDPPDSCDLIVDTRRLDRVLARSPADLTVTAQAGVLLNDLAVVVEADRHTLALLSPRRASRGTAGGLIATYAAGGRRYRYGTPRERLTGITIVLADGTVRRSERAGPADSGRDLVPLFAGSYGTLGLITEATFRLEPRHTVSRGTWLPCTDPEQAVQLAELAADPALAATGINVRWRADGSLGLLVMIQGERDDVQARAEQLCALAGRPAPPPVDRARVVRLDSPDHGGLPPAVRSGCWPSGRRSRPNCATRRPTPGRWSASRSRPRYWPRCWPGSGRWRATAGSGPRSRDRLARACSRPGRPLISRQPPWPGSSPRCGRNWDRPGRPGRPWPG